MPPPIASFFDNPKVFNDFSRLVAQGFGRDGPSLTELIKNDAKSRVAKAEWRGQPVIVKEILTNDRIKAIADLEQEHDRLRRLFPQGDLHFAACLATAPQQGLVILPFAPGQRLDDALRRAPPDRRPLMVQTAVRWLVRSMEGGREIGHFGPDFWQQKLQDHIGKTLLGFDDAELLAGVAVRLATLGPALRGGRVPRGPVHGDFSSQNMFWDAAQGDLHVFDVQSHWTAPVSIDLSWLLGDLTYKTLRDDPNTPLDRGHVAEFRQAAMAVPGLDHPDRPGGFMDFMTGLRHATVLLGKLDHALGPFIRQATQNWLDTVTGE